MQTLDLKCSGLFTHPNPFGSVPAGALIKATNTVIRREDLIETKRGSEVINTFPNPIKKTFVFKSTNLVHHGSSLAYDNAGVYTDYPNTINGPSYPIFSTSANENFYFTTDQGIFKLDEVYNNPRPAGVPQGLGGIPSLISSVANVLPNGENIAYRAVWGYKDANENVILGAPSPRTVIANTSGSTQDVSIQWFIPDAIDTTDYFIQVYRAVPTAIGTPPLDEMYLLDEVTITNTDLTNGYVTYNDNKTTTGATIYTAPSQQGIQNSNYIPPLAKDITTYNQMTFFLNIQTRQTASMVLSKALGDGFGYFDITGDTSIGTFDILNVSSIANARPGQLITGADMTVGTVVSSITPPDTIIMDQVATGSTIGLSFRISDYVSISGEFYYASDVDDYPNRFFKVTNDIEETAISLCNAINSISNTYNAYYLGIGDVDKGAILIEAVNLGVSTFVVDSSYRGAFITNFPLTSTNDDLPHGFQVSKIDQPEAVPLGTLYRVGSGEFPIIRGIALRDGVYIEKGDGIFRVTGSSPTDLVIRKIDNTAILNGQSTPAILDNQIFMFSDQGVATVTQNGIQIVSRAIEKSLLEIAGFPNFKEVAFGVAYESEREYYLFCPTSPDDEYATQAFVYNTFTNAWTRHTAEETFALVSYADNKMYLSNINRLRRERKDYDFSDYHEDEVPVVITAINGLTITLASTTGLVVGWFLFQNNQASKILTIVGNDITIKSEIETLVLGPAFVYEPIETEVQWAPITAQNPTAYKHFQEFITVHEGSKFEDLQVNFFSDLLCLPQNATSVIPVVEGGFGTCPFGEEGFGITHQPSQSIRTFIPLEQSRAPWINILLSLSEAYGKLSLAGQSVVYEMMDTRFR